MNLVLAPGKVNSSQYDVIGRHTMLEVELLKSPRTKASLDSGNLEIHGIKLGFI